MKISIICLNKNHGQFIWKCINSVISQSYSNWELLIADGGSSDDSFDVIKSFNDSRIRLLPGTDANRSAGILRAAEHATGDLIMITTSTDGYVDTDWFKTAVMELKTHPDVALVWGGWTQLKNGHLSFNVGPPSSRFNDTPSSLFSNWLASKDIERTYFPELNYCVYSGVFNKCLVNDNEFPLINDVDPILKFHFNFMKEGYVSLFVPSIANYGREHERQEQFSPTQLSFMNAYQLSLEEYRLAFLSGLKRKFIKRPDGSNLIEIKVS